MEKEPCWKCKGTGNEEDKPVVMGKVKDKNGMVRDVVKSSLMKRCSACLGTRFVTKKDIKDADEVKTKLAGINAARIKRGEKPITLG